MRTWIEMRTKFIKTTNCLHKIGRAGKYFRFYVIFMTFKELTHIKKMKLRFFETKTEKAFN